MKLLSAAVKIEQWIRMICQTINCIDYPLIVLEQTDVVKETCSEFECSQLLVLDWRLGACGNDVLIIKGID